MTYLEYFAVALFALVFPLIGYISHDRMFRHLAAGGGEIRIRVYLTSMTIQWALLILLAYAWQDAGRNVTELGFALPGTLRFWGGVTLAGLAIIPLTYQVFATRSNEDYRHQINEDMGKLVYLMPRTGREYGYFSALSVTAGIVEEVLYRAALIWYLSLWMDTIWAAALALTIFTLAHSYQGPKNALRAGLAGLALTVVYLLSGSIFPAMVLHAVIDLLGGAMGYYALTRGAGAGEDAEANATAEA